MRYNAIIIAVAMLFAVLMVVVAGANAAVGNNCMAVATFCSAVLVLVYVGTASSPRKPILTSLLMLSISIALFFCQKWEKQERICTSTLVSWGYTSVKLGNEIENLCGDGLYSVSFKAKDKKGHKVQGGICCVIE